MSLRNLSKNKPSSNPEISDKPKKKTTDISKHSFINSIILFVLLIAFVTVIPLMFNSRGTNFEAETSQLGISDPGSPGTGSFGLISTAELERTYVSVCTNKTASGTVRKFSGSTIISYNCQKSTNLCSDFICSSVDGLCREVGIDGSECFSNEQCGIGGACDMSTCECFSLPNTTTGCIIDSDCSDIIDRGICAEMECVSGRCVETILGAGECWFNGQCTNFGEVCNQATCACDQMELIPCFANSDCPIITDRGICVENQCTSSNVCNETILGMGECWFDGQCNSTQICDQTTCSCTNREQCASDSDCLDISDRGNCSANLCISGICKESILLNGTCWMNEQCDPSQICNQENCTCIPAPLNQCQVDTDCIDVSDRPCSTSVCNLGHCEESILNAGECWYDGQCTSDEICNQVTCACDPKPLIPCLLNSDCPNITDRGICVEYQCVSERCEETILGMEECWFSGQCGIGFVCDQTTCGCVAMTDTCLTGYDIRALPAGSTAINVTCGIDIAIYNNNAVILCIYHLAGSPDQYLLSSYLKSGDQWFWIDYFTTIITNEGLPLTIGGDIEIWDGYLAFVGKNVNGAQPTTGFLSIYEIAFDGSLNLLQTIGLGSTSALNIAVDIWNTTIVAVNELAFVYDFIGFSTWNLTQVLNDTAFSYVDCAIYEDSIALAVDIDSFNSTSVNTTWESFLLSGSIWTSINGALITDFTGNWRVSLIQTNNPSSPFYDFFIILTPFEVPASLYKIYSAGAILVQDTFFVTSTGIGVISSFNRNVLISDILFINSMTDSTSFNSKFSESTVISNDLYENQPVFLVFNPISGVYTGYANFCDTS